MGTTSYQWRQSKKRLGKRLDSILTTGYFVNCNYHPVKLTEWTWGSKGTDLFGSDVSGIALTNNGGCSCSLAYCMPESITEAVAVEMAEHWRLYGDRGLAVKYGGYTEEGYSQFEKEWK